MVNNNSHVQIAICLKQTKETSSLQSGVGIMELKSKEGYRILCQWKAVQSYKETKCILVKKKIKIKQDMFFLGLSQTKTSKIYQLQKTAEIRPSPISRLVLTSSSVSCPKTTASNKKKIPNYKSTISALTMFSKIGLNKGVNRKGKGENKTCVCKSSLVLSSWTLRARLQMSKIEKAPNRTN